MKRRQFLTGAGSMLAGRHSWAAEAKPFVCRDEEGKPTDGASAVRRQRSDSVRGEDDAFGLVEGAPLIGIASVIDEVYVEQYPGAQGIEGLLVGTKPLAETEAVRHHPSAKKNTMVKAGAGFRLQSMRSLWRQ